MLKRTKAHLGILAKTHCREKESVALLENIPHDEPHWAEVLTTLPSLHKLQYSASVSTNTTVEFSLRLI